jgi:hypothetical protein
MTSKIEGYGCSNCGYLYFPLESRGAWHSCPSCHIGEGEPIYRKSLEPILYKLLLIPLTALTVSAVLLVVGVHLG